MSKWSFYRGDSEVFGEANESSEVVSPCGYIVHIPPPESGPSLPAIATDIASVTLPTVRVAPDVTQKMVTWYEVLVRSTTHQWSVLKRFSEFFDLYKAMEKVTLAQVAKQQLEQSLISPPSRLFSMSGRQQQLEKFVQSLLQTLKDLSVRCLCADNSEPGREREQEQEGSAWRLTTSAVTRVAFSAFIRFLTTTSYDASLEGAVAEGCGATAQLIDKVVADCITINERTYVPPAKIMHVPNQVFTIMLQLPGACMSTVFVNSAEDSREVVVGGSWNDRITGPGSVYGETPDTLQGGTSLPSSAGTVEVNGSHVAVDVSFSAKVLVDTFPVGDFQMEFEVPPPFAVDEWRSQYAGGILFLTWQYGCPGRCSSVENV
ncbi:hypothetical protein TraAM80_05396 [Trypanosoma rangeli]|uniref:PX domain-containing protein n=1 Tax=Trypanosoma rangeli TaxID=5698 RepID=A0A3R7NCD4_TRYRA|nr:uncharacterized protein TraAM80_05396 [Trypanosoma rangeli]RNF04260.1 hypothetical protein TraAM80_05396 [Trypanosoma rangeli]|eukprot:RNF04260.1 hypothetical protein TraAM80_05396 [Trypanosoma rangeli]